MKEIPLLGDPVKVAAFAAAVLAIIWITQNVQFVIDVLNRLRLQKPIGAR